MAENTIKARFKHAVLGDTVTSSSVPKKGEIIFNSEMDNFRVGDGTSTYANLRDVVQDTLWEPGLGEDSIKRKNLTNIASGEKSLSIGYLTEATGARSFAFGSGSIASGRYGISGGICTAANNYGATSLGVYGVAAGQSSCVFGGQWVIMLLVSGEANATTYTYKLAEEDRASFERLINIIDRELFLNYAKSTYVWTSNIDEYWIARILDFTLDYNETIGYHGTIVTERTLSKNVLNDSPVHFLSQVAYGKASFSEGNGTIAIGRGSHSAGEETIALNQSEYAIGTYNIPHKSSDTFGNAGNSIYTIGIGTDKANSKNAFEVMQNGDIYVYGIGNYNGTNPSNATRLQDYIPYVYDWAKSVNKPSYTWNEINDKPSTFTPSTHDHDSRYYISNGTIYLGSNNITPVTSLTSHAKVADTSTNGQVLISKTGGYEWVTLGSNAFTSKTSLSQFIDDLGDDPTHTHSRYVETSDSRLSDARPASDVYSWAKQSTKPSYNFSEISGTVSSNQLPSYVDDVLEYTSKASFPATGETGKIYVDTTANLTYRWSGSQYVEISPSLALGETSSTAYRGDRGATAYSHATDANRLTTAKDTGLYKIATTSEGHIKSVTAVAKSDITALGIPGSDTTYSNATQSTAGLMSSTDKTKLDGIASGATAVSESTVSGWGFTKNSGTVTSVKVGSTSYDPSSGVVSLPAYPTTLPASDVYSWAKQSSKPSYNLDEVSDGTTRKIPTKVSELTNDSGYTTNTGTVTGVNVGSTSYSPSSGIISLPAYPTTLPASDVYSWAKQSSKPSYAWSEITDKPSTFTPSAHTHNTSIAKDSGTSSLTLEFSGKYAITAGGTKYIFTMPANPNTDHYDWSDITNKPSTYTPSSHTHTKSQITDFPTSMPASDVYAWAKASSKPSYTYSEVGAAAAGHTHNTSIAKSDSTNQLTLAFGSKYALTAGGTSYIFTMPSNPDTWRPLGTGANDACAGNDSRLSNSRPASDVYAWAKASSKPSYSFSEISGTVSSSQLPSYVDDVLEYASKSNFPSTGESGKIYVALDTNLTYRWSGSAYIEISPSLALGETSSTAYRGDRGKAAYDHSQSTHARTDATAVAASSTNGNIKINGTETTVYTHPGSGTNPHGTTKSDVGLGNVENKSSATIRGELTKSNVTTALGYTPYDASNPNGYISSYTNTAQLQVSDTTNKRINTKQSTGNYIQFTGGTNKFTVGDGTNSFDVAVTPSVTFPVTKVAGYTGAVTTANIATALTGAGYKLTDTWTAADVSNAGYVPKSIKGKFLHANASTGALEWTDDNNTTYTFTGSGVSVSGTTVTISDTTYSVATQSANGLMSSTDKTKLDGIASGATAVLSSTVSGWGFTKNTGTVTQVKVGTTAYDPSSGVVSLPAYPSVPTKVSQLTNDSGYVTSSGVTSVATGIGLTGGTITSTGTVKANLRGETKRSTASVVATDDGNRHYAVSADKDGYLSVVVPWTNVNSSYLTSQDHYKTSITAGTAGTSSATSGSTLEVPYVTVNANGHVTGYGTHTHTISGFLTSSSTLNAANLSGTVPSGCYTDTLPYFTIASSTSTSSNLSVTFSGIRDYKSYNVSSNINLSVNRDSIQPTDSYLLLNNTGSSDIVVTLSSITFRGNSISTIKVPSEAIKIKSVKSVEISFMINSNLAIVTASSELT